MPFPADFKKRCVFCCTGGRGMCPRKQILLFSRKRKIEEFSPRGVSRQCLLSFMQIGRRQSARCGSIGCRFTPLKRNRTQKKKLLLPLDRVIHWYIAVFLYFNSTIFFVKLEENGNKSLLLKGNIPSVRILWLFYN